MGYPRLTMTECFVIVLCIGLLAILALPTILMSRGESRSATCQYHQIALILATRQLVEQTANPDPAKWPQQLAGVLADPQIVYHCPSDERQPPREASYGINNRAYQMSDTDPEKGIFLDYNAILAEVVGTGAAANWQSFIAPRHFEFVNLAFHDSRVELRDPAAIDPAQCTNVLQVWLPDVDRPLLSDDCQYSTPLGNPEN